jgi:hypothetical protein
MATVTPNFNWPVPTSTDLVKDGATAIEALGDSIDASMVDLKGGTTGQVLAKASNTDMDFTWVTDAAGDITGVTAGTGISGGGTSGTVTITNSMATAIDAKGDLVPGTGADTFARLAVGANGTVLTADSAEATGMKWATAGGGGAMVQIADTTLGSAAADITFSSIPSTYNHLKLVISGACASTSFNGTTFNVQVNGDTSNNYAFATVSKYAGAGATMTLEGQFSQTQFELGNIWVGQAVTNALASVEMTFFNYKGTTLRKGMTFIGGGWSDAPGTGSGSGAWKSTSAITSIKLYSGGGNFMTGTRATLYGWT